ncbi:hypothetical protein DYB36_010171, partial [Aphanomyces astaci]
IDYKPDLHNAARGLGFTFPGSLLAPSRKVGHHRASSQKLTGSAASSAVTSKLIR